MKISAYIPCYNVERYIGPTIEAMLAQTRPPDEFLIIDDGCTDGTLDIAAKYPVRIIRHEKNRGLAAGRNTAFANSQHELVAAMDSDAVAEKHWLESLHEAFNDPRVVGSGGRLLEKYREGAANAWRAAYMSQDLGETRIEIEWPSPKRLGGFGTLYRKSAVLAAGGYDEQYRTNYEDVDLCIRLLQAGHKMVFEPRAVAHHFRQDTVRSLLRTSWRWEFYMHYFNGGYNNIPLKLLHNFRWARAMMWNDWRDGRKSRLGVDALMPWYHCYADLCYGFSAGRLPAVKAEGPNAELYFPRPIRALRRRYRGSHQRA
ncbi:MAG: glycosyltransferase [Candidatus Acidiferrales bacterium]